MGAWGALTRVPHHRRPKQVFNLKGPRASQGSVLCPSLAAGEAQSSLLPVLTPRVIFKLASRSRNSDLGSSHQSHTVRTEKRTTKQKRCVLVGPAWEIHANPQETHSEICSLQDAFPEGQTPATHPQPRPRAGA